MFGTGPTLQWLLGEKDIAQIALWQEFYYKCFGFRFGLKISLETLKAPEKKPGFEFPVIVVPEMSPQILFDKCKELFSCENRSMVNLDDIIRSERTAKDGAYLVWANKTIEADANLRGRSAKNLAEAGISCMTLEERLLMELMHYHEEQWHLDLDGRTLCSDSIRANGSVPFVSWNNSERSLVVDFCSDEDWDEDLSARQVAA